MVLLCDRCRKSFALPLGEETWLETRAVVPKQNLCIECKISLGLTPVPEILPTIDRDLVLSSSTKLGLRDVELPSVEHTKLKQPIAEFFPRGIKWQYFPAGRKISGSVTEPVDEGSKRICVTIKVGQDLFSLATLTVFPEFSACETRSIILNAHGQAGETHATFLVIQIDEPFRGNITIGTRCTLFGVPAGQIPAPLCDAGHNIIAKRHALARAEERAVAAARRVPRDVLAAQTNTVLCDPWGPPVKAAASSSAQRPYSCADYLDAIVACARDGHSAVTEHLHRWDDAALSAVLAVCAAGHDRLGAASPLALLPPPLLRRIVFHAFPCRMTALPKWKYIDAVASRIQPHLQEPCAVAVVTLLDEDVHAAHEDRAAQVRSKAASLKRLGHKPGRAAAARRGSERWTANLRSSLLKIEAITAIGSGAAPAAAPAPEPAEAAARRWISRLQGAGGAAASSSAAGPEGTKAAVADSEAGAGGGNAVSKSAAGPAIAPAGAPPAPAPAGSRPEPVAPAFGFGLGPVANGERAAYRVKTRGAMATVMMISKINQARAASAERILVVDRAVRCVHAFLMNGEHERSFGEAALRAPAGAAALDGRILVTDAWLHCVHVFTGRGRWLGRFGSFGRGPGQFNAPTGIATAGGLVYVCDTNNHRVQVLSLTVDEEGAAAAAARAGAGGAGPGGGAVRAAAVRVIGGGQGVRPGQLDHPASVAVGPGGEVAVTEPRSARAQVFAADGTVARVLKAVDWGRDAAGRAVLRADASGMVCEVGVPTSVAYCERTGRLFVADGFYHRVVVFDGGGHAVQKFAAGSGWGAVPAWEEPFRGWRKAGLPLGRELWTPQGGGGPSELHGPASLACAASGHVVVCDAGNRRVGVFI